MCSNVFALTDTLKVIVSLSEIEPLYNVTVLSTSATPEIVGVLSITCEEVDKDEGALGASVSKMTWIADEDDDVLPATSVAVAINA